MLTKYYRLPGQIAGGGQGQGSGRGNGGPARGKGGGQGGGGSTRVDSLVNVIELDATGLSNGVGDNFTDYGSANKTWTDGGGSAVVTTSNPPSSEFNAWFQVPNASTAIGRAWDSDIGPNDALPWAIGGYFRTGSAIASTYLGGVEGAAATAAVTAVAFYIDSSSRFNIIVSDGTTRTVHNTGIVLSTNTNYFIWLERVGNWLVPSVNGVLGTALAFSGNLNLPVGQTIGLGAMPAGVTNTNGIRVGPFVVRKGDHKYGGAAFTPPTTIAQLQEAVGTAWSGQDKSGAVTLSNGNLSAATSTTDFVRANRGRTSGRYYFEIRSVNGTSGTSAMCGLPGIATLANTTMTQYVGQSTTSYGFAGLHRTPTKYNNTVGTALSIDQVIGVGLKNGELKFFVSGAGAVAYSGLTGTVYPMWGPSTSGAGTRTATLNTGASAWAYPVAAADYASWGGTWNSADKDADVALSGGDLVASVTAALGGVRGTQGRSATDSGGFYFEIRIAGTDMIHVAGIGNSSAAITGYPGSDANGWGYYPHDRVRYNAATLQSFYLNDEYIGFDIDLTAGTMAVIWAGVRRDSVFTGLPAGTYFPAYSSASDGFGVQTGTLNVGASSFAYGLPSGATAWG